ncbi:hypothetical protein C2G38_2038587 [Gigaspora rosea]|uniref:Uncharacterized protein n=1 Tax=Gigaspora rosea TaxID=44941 RepID=A0A397V4Z0_9GLOM|nr:hypothetical protein C2G38_2038587 [Gigaspora rosea]
MSAQQAFHEDSTFSNQEKRKRRAQYCNLKGQKNVVCSNEKHGAYIVSDQILISSSSQHLDLVGKLCAKNTKAKSIKKAPKHLVNFFELPQGAMICRCCLYKTDNNTEYINSSNYQLLIKKFWQIRLENFKELESAYYEVVQSLTKQS